MTYLCCIVSFETADVIKQQDFVLDVCTHGVGYASSCDLILHYARINLIKWSAQANRVSSPRSLNNRVMFILYILIFFK